MTTAHVFMFALAFLVGALLMRNWGCILPLAALAAVTLMTGVETIGNPALLAAANANHPTIVNAPPGMVDSAAGVGALLVVVLVALVAWKGVRS